MVRRCPKCNKDLAWEEIGKGYEVAKGEYALFTKEELAKLDGDETGGTIEIVEFVDPLEVDLAYVEKSYWVGPGSKNVRGYDLLRSVLAETKKVALAKVRLRTRTRLALLRPRGQALLARHDALRRGAGGRATSWPPPTQKEPSPREKQLALHLVEELSGPFDPARHPDEYRSAVLAAVEREGRGGPGVARKRPRKRPPRRRRPARRSSIWRSCSRGRSRRPASPVRPRPVRTRRTTPRRRRPPRPRARRRASGRRARSRSWRSRARTAFAAARSLASQRLLEGRADGLQHLHARPLLVVRLDQVPRAAGSVLVRSTMSQTARW